jgi:hypothetical protein
MQPSTRSHGTKARRRKPWLIVLIGISAVIASVIGYNLYRSLEAPTRIHITPVFVLTGAANRSAGLTPCKGAVVAPVTSWSCSFIISNDFSPASGSDLTVSSITEAGFEVISISPTPPQVIGVQTSMIFSIMMLTPNEPGEWSPTITITVSVQG